MSVEVADDAPNGPHRTVDSGGFGLIGPYGQVASANITQAPLTITANNATKVYGTTAILATTAFTSTGLVNAETVGGVTLTSPGTVATARPEATTTT